MCIKYSFQLTVLSYSGLNVEGLVLIIMPDLQQSRGCLGCCTKPQLIIAVDEPSKGLKIQGRAVKKSSLTQDIWSSSTYEMDNSAVQSQRSISSISASNQNLDPHGGSGSASNPSEYVNNGKFEAAFFSAYFPQIQLSP